MSPRDRIPPQDLDAEASLLGAILLDSGAIEGATVGALAPEDFVRPDHQHAFTAMRSLYNRGDPIDAVSLADALRAAGVVEDAKALAIELQESPPAILNAEHYAAIVLKHAKRRGVIRHAATASSIAYANDDPAVAIAALTDGASAIEARDAANLVPVTSKEPPWPRMGAEAYYGIAGEIVEASREHTEADPVAVLISLLAAIGSAIGGTPCIYADNVRHGVNEFFGIIGATAKARKGTSVALTRRFMIEADPAWVTTCSMSGFGSGESVIAELLSDERNKDERLFIDESELARVLTVCGRDGSTLSPILRNAWDGRPLHARTRDSRLAAESHHISVLAQITIDEYRRKLTDTEAANGFANRFIPVLVQRSQLLPDGGSVPDDVVRTLGRQLRRRIEGARAIARVDRGPDAAEYWAKVYHSLAARDGVGLAATLTARAEAHTLRLSLLYAVLDGSHSIELPHIAAAWAIWKYADASARYVFGEGLGDPLAERLWHAIEAAGKNGLTRVQIRAVVGSNNVPAARIEEALGLIARTGGAAKLARGTDGRSAEVWVPTRM